ncbi:hypothetical protein MPHO_06590 [Mycolicibacterium phocaicum]|nr:hypothetical protein MPHO_06590 [Mycolicibacterium phocaicum]
MPVGGWAGEAVALEADDVLVVLLVLLVELVVSDDGLSSLHPASPKTAAMPTAPIATCCLTLAPLLSSST